MNRSWIQSQPTLPEPEVLPLLELEPAELPEPEVLPLLELEPAELPEPALLPLSELPLLLLDPQPLHGPNLSDNPSYSILPWGHSLPVNITAVLPGPPMVRIHLLMFGFHVS
jgi:hypothetical protein